MVRSTERCYIIRYCFSDANVTDYGAAHNLLCNGIPYYVCVIFENNYYCGYTESRERNVEEKRQCTHISNASFFMFMAV